MRPVLAVLVLVLSACGPAPLEPLCAPGESRSCACTSGAMGAQVCGGDRQHFEPCVCNGADGGAELDDAGAPPLDASIDGGSADAGTDAAVAIVDGGPRDAALVDAGRCTVFPPAGCPDGMACRYQGAGATRTVACEPAGTGRDGEPCEEYAAGGDSCRPGYFCEVFCRRSCSTDEDCPVLAGRDRVCDPGGAAGPFCVNAP